MRESPAAGWGERVKGTGRSVCRDRMNLVESEDETLRSDEERTAVSLLFDGPEGGMRSSFRCGDGRRGRGPSVVVSGGAMVFRIRFTIE